MHCMWFYAELCSHPSQCLISSEETPTPESSYMLRQKRLEEQEQKRLLKAEYSLIRNK